MANGFQTVIRYLRGVSGADAPDDHLLGSYVSGNQDAFNDLVARHGPLVWGVCRRLLRHQDAEDAYQATFLVLARRADRITQPRYLSTWLYSVAYRAALEARKRSPRTVPLGDVDVPAPAEAPAIEAADIR